MVTGRHLLDWLLWRSADRTPKQVARFWIQACNITPWKVWQQRQKAAQRGRRAMGSGHAGVSQKWWKGIETNTQKDTVQSRSRPPMVLVPPRKPKPIPDGCHLSSGGSPGSAWTGTPAFLHTMPLILAHTSFFLPSCHSSHALVFFPRHKPTNTTKKYILLYSVLRKLQIPHTSEVSAGWGAWDGTCLRHVKATHVKEFTETKWVRYLAWQSQSPAGRPLVQWLHGTQKADAWPDYTTGSRSHG